MYLYITSRSESETELIKAECFAITGAYPDDNGIAIKSSESQHEYNDYTDVSRSAYIKLCMKIILQANELPNLYESLNKADIKSDQFRVSVIKIPRNIKADPQDIMYQVGLRIDGKPNLTNPKAEFLVVMNEENIWLGEVLSKSDGLWESHTQKIQQYSSALPTRFARALVNLVARPGDRIIDPCCGSGTILIESASMGIKALGCDINPLMVWASMRNIRDFGLDVPLAITDARIIKGSFDAVITDLPYGRSCPSSEDLYYEILENLCNIAPRAAIVAGMDISNLLLQLGFQVKYVIAVPKGSLVRYIHVSDPNKE